MVVESIFFLEHFQNIPFSGSFTASSVWHLNEGIQRYSFVELIYRLDCAWEVERSNRRTAGNCSGNEEPLEDHAVQSGGASQDAGGNRQKAGSHCWRRRWWGWSAILITCLYRWSVCLQWDILLARHAFLSWGRNGSRDERNECLRWRLLVGWQRSNARCMRSSRHKFTKANTDKCRTFHFNRKT